MGGKQVDSFSLSVSFPRGDENSDSAHHQTFAYKRNNNFNLGQNLIEFALVLPVLFLVLFGVIDLGRIFHATITISNSARVGARHLTMYPDEIDNAKVFAVQEAQESGIHIMYENVTVRCFVDDVYQVVSSGDVCDHLTEVAVSVSHQFQLLMGPILPRNLSTPDSSDAADDSCPLCFTIRRTAEMLVQ